MVIKWSINSRQAFCTLTLVAILCLIAIQFRLLKQHHAADTPKIIDPGEPRPNTVTKTPLQSSTLQWKNGCLVSRSLPRKSIDSQPPKGLVVTMALAPKNRQHLAQGRSQICQNLINQWVFFLNPQQMDALLVIQDEDKRWNTKRFSNCLNLTSTNNTKTWKNFDGSQLTTTEYRYPSLPNTKIYLAATTVYYPLYIRKNHTLLELRKRGPQGCSARLRYLQGCRWYTREMLHLAILQEYDYFLKMDTDIIFRKSPNFFMLQDMQNKGAVFAHAAEYHPRGDGSCAPGILTAISEFVTQSSYKGLTTKNSPSSWKSSVCSDTPEVQRDTDQYYGNFLVGSVEYFTSPWVLEFANFMSEYPQGYFYNLWGDQIFWHFAMGLFLDQFTNYVVDYTDLRCKPDPTCWYSIFDKEKWGPNATERCDDPKGIFAHTKSLEFAQMVRESALYIPSIPTVLDDLSQPLFVSTYKHCRP